MNTIDPVQDLLSRLDGVRQTGPTQYMAKCPGHDDRRASLSVGRGDDGRALVHCHAGCAPGDVLTKVGLRGSELFAANVSKPAPRPPVPVAPEAGTSRTIYRTPQEALAEAGRRAKGVLVGAWTYPGDALRIARFRLADGGKTFRPIHCKAIGQAVGWVIGDPPGLLPLYRGDGLPDAGPIVVVEGEKCADAAATIGLPAVTSAHGGESARKSDWQPLAGREVIILPDNDDTGRKYGQDVATILNKLTPPTVVKIVELPGLGESGDIADWIDADGPMGSKSADEIKAAVLGLAKTAKPFTPSVKSLEGEPVITSLADVTPVPVKWFWPSRIALGKLTLIVGDPGLGKSFITLDLASRVSTGTALPDCPSANSTPGGVVLLSAEDDLGDTIRPRLDAAGADVRRIVALTTIKRFDPAKGKDVFEPFNLTDHLPALERAMKQVDQCRLVVIDPVSAYLGGTDSHKNADIRGILAPLSELAARHGVAVIAVTHLRKGEGPAMYRAMGSLAFIAAARAAYCVTPDKGDAPGQRRFFLPIKNNLGNDRNGLAYCLDNTFSANGQPVVKWEATPVSISADEALNDDGGRGEEDTSELEEAKTWLADALAAGPMPAKDVLAQARQDGVSKRTLDRAKKSLNVTTSKAQGIANGGWSWSLPQGAPQDRQDASEGNLGDVGNLPEKPAQNEAFAGSRIEDRQGCQEVQDRQEGEGCQPPPVEAVTPPMVARLDPDRPGPTDLLSKAQYRRYRAVYEAHDGEPGHKHAAAWREAVAGRRE